MGVTAGVLGTSAGTVAAGVVLAPFTGFAWSGRKVFLTERNKGDEEKPPRQKKKNCQKRNVIGQGKRASVRLRCVGSCGARKAWGVREVRQRGTEEGEGLSLVAFLAGRGKAFVFVNGPR